MRIFSFIESCLPTVSAMEVFRAFVISWDSLYSLDSAFALASLRRSFTSLTSMSRASASLMESFTDENSAWSDLNDASSARSLASLILTMASSYDFLSTRASESFSTSMMADVSAPTDAASSSLSWATAMRLSHSSLPTFSRLRVISPMISFVSVSSPDSILRLASAIFSRTASMTSSCCWKPSTNWSRLRSLAPSAEVTIALAVSRLSSARLTAFDRFSPDIASAARWSAVSASPISAPISLPSFTISSARSVLVLAMSNIRFLAAEMPSDKAPDDFS